MGQRAADIAEGGGIVRAETAPVEFGVKCHRPRRQPVKSRHAFMAKPEPVERGGDCAPAIRGPVEVQHEDRINQRCPLSFQALLHRQVRNPAQLWRK